MKTNEESRGTRKYWAIGCRAPWSRRWTGGYATDFYPEERNRLLTRIRRDKYRMILGEFDSWEEAYAAAKEFAATQIHK
jgi:hypothetical protein